VFERFTERARQVVVLAQDEARALKHGYIGTEHLLLGVLREEEGIAARALAGLGVTLEGARARVLAIVGQGDGDAATGQIPFTPRGKQALELSLRESQALGHAYIGTEHILLGLLRQGEGVAPQVLHDLNVSEDSARAQVIRLIGGSAPPTVVTSSGPRPPRWPVAEGVPGWRQRRRLVPVTLLLAGWLLFALALGAGILVGWAIWGS
jgi:ATP-dependent Clp protease ATP-binding subunit ClpC